MELDVLLKVSTQLVTIQVIAEGETLSRDQHVYLIPHRHRKKGLQTICRAKQGEKTFLRPVSHQGHPTSGTQSTPVARDTAALWRSYARLVSWSDWLTGHLPKPASSHAKSRLVYCPLWQPKHGLPKSIQNELRMHTQKLKPGVKPLSR